MKTAWQEDAVCKNRNDGDGSMHRTENVELTVVCLLEDGGKVLLQNRKKEDWHGWALPGGHVAPGEPSERLSSCACSAVARTASIR